MKRPLVAACLLVVTACPGTSPPGGRDDSRGSISGRVVLAPVTGARDFSRVRVEAGRGEGGVTPDGDGNFEMSDLEPDTYNLQVTYIGGLSAEATGSAYLPVNVRAVLRAGGSLGLGEITPELAEGSIAGAVTAQMGAAAQGSTVRLVPVDENGARVVGTTLEVMTSADGAWAFPRVKVGRYAVTVHPPAGQALAAQVPAQGCAAAAMVSVGDAAVSIPPYNVVPTRVALEPGANELSRRDVDTWYARPDRTSVTINVVAAFAYAGRTWTDDATPPAYAPFRAEGYAVDASADGRQTVHLQFTDPCGLESPVYDVVIIKDTMAPALRPVLLAGGLTRVGTQVIPVQVGAGSADDDVATMGFYEGTPGADCPARACGDTGFETLASSTVFALSQGLGPKRVCWRFCDASGNGSDVGHGDLELTTYLPRPRPVLSGVRCHFAGGNVEDGCETVAADSGLVGLEFVGTGLAHDTAVLLDALVLECASDDDTGRDCSVNGGCDSSCTLMPLPRLLSTQSGTHTLRLRTPDPVEGGAGESVDVRTLTVFAPVPRLLTNAPRGVIQRLDDVGEPVEQLFDVTGCAARVMENAAFSLGDVLAVRQELVDQPGNADCPQRFSVTLSTRGLLPLEGGRYALAVENPPPAGGRHEVPFALHPAYAPCNGALEQRCSLDLRASTAHTWGQPARGAELPFPHPLNSGYLALAGNVALVMEDARGGVVGGFPASGLSQLLQVPPFASVVRARVVDTEGLQPRAILGRPRMGVPSGGGTSAIQLNDRLLMTSTMGDFDADGALDVLGPWNAGDGTDAMVVLSDGSAPWAANPPALVGSMAPPPPLNSVGLFAIPVPADMDGDGIPDVVTPFAVTTRSLADPTLVPADFRVVLSVRAGGGVGLGNLQTIQLANMAEFCGARSFEECVEPVGTLGVLRVDVRDMTGDGLLDAVVFLGPYIGVFPFNQQGRPMPGHFITAPDDQLVLDYALADMDGDDRRDIIAHVYRSNPSTSATLVWAQQADGSFGTPVTAYPTASEGVPVVTDLDWDGRLDLVLPAAVDGSGGVVLCALHNDGNLVFSAACQPMVDGPSALRTVALGAADLVADRPGGPQLGRDGMLDVVLQARSVLPNNESAALVAAVRPDGTLAAPIRITDDTFDMRRFWLADVDVNGAFEAVGSKSPSLLAGTTLLAPPIPATVSLMVSTRSENGARATRLGQECALFTNKTTSLNLVAVGMTSTGPGVQGNWMLGPGETPYAPRVADLDGDGDDDVVAVSGATSMLVAYQGSTGTFTTRQSLAGVPNREGRFVIADVDGARPDIVGLSIEGQYPQPDLLHLHASRHTGGTQATAYGAPTVSTFLAPDVVMDAMSMEIQDEDAADVSGDGLQDVVLAIIGSAPGWTVRTVTGFISNGTGGFTVRRLVTLSGDQRVGTVRLADLDDDGRADLVVGLEAPRHTLLIYMQQTTGFFDVAPLELSPQDPDNGPVSNNTFQDVDVVDINGDGLKDLAWWVGRGPSFAFRAVPGPVDARTFSEPIHLPDATYGARAVFADVNRDGVRDPVVSRGSDFVDIQYVPPAARVRTRWSSTSPVTVAAGAPGTVTFAGSPLVVERVAWTLRFSAPVTATSVAVELEAPTGARVDLACALPSTGAGTTVVHVSEGGCADFSTLHGAQVASPVRPWVVHVTSLAGVPVTVERVDAWVQGTHGNVP